MNLLLSSLARLSLVYGERDAGRVLEAIEQLIQAREARGIRSRLLLVEEGAPDLGVGGDTVSSTVVHEQLADAALALEQAGDRLESVLIVGGPSVVPFNLAPNPTPFDGDIDVPNDLAYGGREPHALVPEWPVGRLPGAEGPRARATLLLRLLRQATRLHKAGPRAQLEKTFGYAAAAWREASGLVYQAIGDAPLLESPPTVATTLDHSLLDGASAVYCNLHGVRDGPIWYGQAENTDGLLVALRLEDVLRLRLDGALVLSEACYGAAIAGRSERSSLALAFLARGARGFVGATAMSYGQANVPPGEADLLALHFWQAAARGETTTGQALLDARTAMLRDVLTRQSVLDDDDRKTALEFVLYGDPALSV